MSISDGSVIPRIKEVDSQLSSLDKTLDKLDSLVSDLNQRLGRVSKQIPAVPVQDSIEALVPLANQVRDLQLRAAKITLILESMLDCLEI